MGGAKALHLEDKVGTLKPGSEADFIVLSFAETSLQKLRIKKTEEKLRLSQINHIEALADKLFVLMSLGDDRNIKATFIDGKQAFAN